MLPDLTPIEWLSIASFSLAIGGLVLRFIISNPSAKEHLAAAALLFAVIALSINVLHYARCAHEAKQLSVRVIEILGNGEKTLDQVLIELNNPDLKTFAKAFILLNSEDRLDNRMEEVHLTRQQTVQIRLWRAKADRQNR